MQRMWMGTILSSMVLASFAHAAQWDIDASHSDVAFSVRHLMVSDTKGAFDQVKGTLNLDEKDVAKSKVDVEIETASVNTRNKDRDDHLRGADFFDAAKYPKITFTSTKVEKKDGALWVTGDLTLHGVTKPVVLKTEGPTAEVQDPFGKTRTGFKATTQISRKEFGLTWNKALDKGGVAIGDDVKITIDVELTKAAPAPAPKKS